MQGVWVRSLVGKQRSHKPLGRKTENRSNRVINLSKNMCFKINDVQQCHCKSKLNYDTLISSHPSTEVYILGLPPAYLGGGGMALGDSVKFLISFRRLSWLLPVYQLNNIQLFNSDKITSCRILAE